MQFLAISALALTVIGRCLAEPIPVNVLPRGDPLNGVPGIGSRPFNNLPANDLNAFWPCVRCSIDCAAVAFGCGVVCLAAEIDGPLCGLCIAGAGGSGACVECWPRCHGGQAKHPILQPGFHPAAGPA